MSNTQISKGKYKAKKSLRADAALVMFMILEKGQSARQCLPEIQEGHSEQDKAWLQEMVYGMLRRLPLLQFWLRKLLDKPLKNKYKVVEHLIILGFYQLAFSRVSTHAAVSETVDATQSLNAQPLKGLVNALLRNFIRQNLADQPVDNLQIEYGLPKWLYKRLLAAYPDDLIRIQEAMLVRPPIWLRVNQTKVSKATFEATLLDHDIAFSKSDEHPSALILQKSVDVTSLPGYDEGWFAVQDGAAQLAAHYLDAQPAERILDCCAAPGGKTCHVLEMQPELAECIALDVDESRLQRVSENLQRLDLRAKLLTADATDIESWWDNQPFDRILLDAPCSATGVIRRHPDIKWLRKNTDIDTLVNLQQQILENMWRILKPGGTLLYATCSILPEENQLQIAAFLKKHQDATLIKITETETNSRPGRQILPGQGQMDGFYYARLIKS